MDNTRLVPVRIGDREIRIEATQIGEEQEIAASHFDFQDVCDTLSGFIEALQSTLKKVSPQKTTVEFGVEIAAEAGQLTALIIKGSGKANLKISMEWSDPA